MEYRKHKREAVSLVVMLVQHGRVVASARTIDMSLYGLGLNCAERQFNSGEKVGVVFSRPGHPRGMSYCIPSRVVHASEEMIGLKLAYEPRLHMVLNEQNSVARSVNG